MILPELQGIFGIFLDTILLFREEDMKYELHDLDIRHLPLSLHRDEMRKGEKDFTHWHENIELLFFLAGKGRVVCDFRKEDVQAGDIFVINSELLHMVESDDFIRYDCLIPGTDFLEQNGILPSLRFQSRIRDETVWSNYEKLAAEYAKKGEFRDTRVRVATLELLLDLAERFQASGEREDADTAEPHLQNVKEAIRYIKIRFPEKITVDEIAAAAGLSKAYLAREFRRITGFTMINYLNLVRCRYAKKMLATGEYRINRVAIESGFDNLSYFTRTYKRIMGCLPSEEATIHHTK